MTLQQILNSVSVIQKMTELKLPIKKAYKIYSLAKQINNKRDFFINEEKKLIEQFHAEVAPNGQISFSNQEDQSQFIKEYSDLANYEIDDIEVLELKFDDLGDAEFSPNELAMLDGIVNFVD